MPPPENDAYQGLAGAAADASAYNQVNFLVRAILNNTATVTLVQVMGVTSGGEAAKAVFIDVMPLVNQVDGKGNATPHGIIHDIPFVRLQAGRNAVIIDPQVGDIGLALVCSRDISGVKATGAAATPGMVRSFDYADSIYLGAVLGDAPEQYLAFRGGMDAETPGLAVSGNLSAGTGADGTFPTGTGGIVTVLGGLIVDLPS